MTSGKPMQSVGSKRWGQARVVGDIRHGAIQISERNRSQFCILSAYVTKADVTRRCAFRCFVLFCSRLIRVRHPSYSVCFCHKGRRDRAVFVQMFCSILFQANPCTTSEFDHHLTLAVLDELCFSYVSPCSLWDTARPNDVQKTYSNMSYRSIQDQSSLSFLREVQVGHTRVLLCLCMKFTIRTMGMYETYYSMSKSFFA